MEGKPVGTIFAELALDTTSYTKSQREILASASQTALNVEKNWRVIGEKSDVMYDAMRQRIQNAYERIANSANATQQEITRAQQAAADKIKSIDEQQYGRQTSMLDSMKKNWIATSAVIAAAWMTARKAMEWAEIGAKAQQAEESFRIVAANTGATADKLLADLKRVSAGTVDESGIMQKAVKGMALGLKDNQIVQIMEAARISARVAGEDVVTAYEGITDAISTQMPKALKRYGLITMDEMSLVKKAMKEGIDNVDLYTLAMLNAEIQAARMGAAHTNASESVQTFHAHIKEIRETIGKFILDLGQSILSGLYGFAGAVSVMAAPLAYLIGGREAYNAMVASGNDLMDKARKMTGAYTDEEKKAQGEAAKGASERIAAAERKKKEWSDSLKAQIDSAKEAKDSAKEMERLKEQWVETKRALEGKVESEGVDKYTKRLIDIRVEAERLLEKFKAIPGAADVIENWRGSAERGVETDRSAEVLKFEREAQEKIAEERRKAADEYKRIVTEANDWSISEHQRAINKILSDEQANVARMYELWGAGAINLEQLTAGLSAVSAAGDAAVEAQTQKTLVDMVNFYSQITGYEEEYRNKQMEWIDREAKRRAELYRDEVAAAKWAAQQKGRLEQELFEKKTSQVHKGLGDMKDAFESIGSMYDTNSKEYARMQEAAKAMVVLQQGVAVANAVAAIANQGLGEPYTAFPRIAAMAAAMGSLLASIGASVSGGGAAAPVLPASTVLGAEPGTGSESVAKVWELLKDTYDLEYRELTGIHESVRELNQNITGLVTSIVRTGGIGGMDFVPSSKATRFGTFGEDINPKEYSGIAGWVEDLGNWFLNTVVGGIFGGGMESVLASSGIEFKGITAGELIAGKYVDAMQYALVRTVVDGGWFKSDKTYWQTLYKSLDSDVTRLFTLVFRNMSETLVEVARNLGGDVNAAMAYAFKGEQINLLGKSSEEINKTLSEYFSRVGDEAVKALFGDLVGRYQQLNEGMFETAVRLMTDLASVRNVLEMTGQSFRGTTSSAIEFSESLIRLAGGLDELRDAASTYYDKFFSDEEKQVRLGGQLAGALADMNLSLPATRAGYRALVEALDLTTSAGKSAYVALLSMAEAADQYYSTGEDALKAAQDEYLRAQKEYIDEQVRLVEGLRSRVESVTRWMSEMDRGALAAVGSAQAWETEYARLKEKASVSGATDQEVSAFLSYAKEYLSFQKRYTGGSYQDAYDLVMRDVQAIGDMAAEQLPVAEAQLAAIQSADDAARAAAEAQLAATQETNARLLQIAAMQDSYVRRLAGGTPTGYYPAFASGGLASGPSIFGESGPEWAVPTYEPQRSRFLKDVGADPDSIGRAVARHLVGVSAPAGDGKDLTVNLFIDGKHITGAVVRGLRTGDQELVKSVRRVVA